jgi:hypothetical protein
MLWIVLSVIASLFYWLLLVPGEIVIPGLPMPGGLYVPVIYVLSLVTAFIGYKIGTAIRNFARPDVIWVSGGFRELMEAKIWWMIGLPGSGYCGGVIVPFLAISKLIEAGFLPG